MRTRTWLRCCCLRDCRDCNAWERSKAVIDQAYQWALTRKRTLLGSGSLQLLDLHLFEDGGERGSALGSDVVVVRNTASKGQDGNNERVGVSMCQWAMTRMQTPWGGGALEGGDLRVLEDRSKRNGTIVLDVVLPETAKHGRG